MVSQRWRVARVLVSPPRESSTLVNNHLVQDEIPNLCAHARAPTTLRVLVCLDLANSS